MSAEAAREAWRDALLVARMIGRGCSDASAHGLGGAIVRARWGPARDRWLEALKAELPEDAPLLKAPSHAGEEALLGGLDLTSTLAHGRPIARSGLLARADRGVILAPMAERMEPGAAALLALALDHGRIDLQRDGLARSQAARFSLILFDESEEGEEGVGSALLERLAFRIDLGDLALTDLDAAIEEPPAPIASAELSREEAIESLCSAALAFGVASTRAPIFALRAAAASAALEGRSAFVADDLARAARLTLAPRATRLPPEPEEERPPEEAPPPPPEDRPENEPSGEDEGETDPNELVLDAVRAALPPQLLAEAAARRAQAGDARSAGRFGQRRRAPRRGRPVGVTPGTRGRIDVLATLRTAAPWQRVRERDAGADERTGLRVRPEDFRIKRLKQPQVSTVIFVVDASGSAAMQRLNEAKGAVELLLADCYARRDEAALIAFRGKEGEIVLPPTRALARAKRALAGLPGGGGTPLAAGIDRALELAIDQERRGARPIVVVLSDGRANIGRDGSPGRAQAAADARAAAERMRASAVASLFVDTSPRPSADARSVADAMGASYVALPRADAEALSGVVRARMGPS